MGKAKREIRIGTSGWYYEHWRERFYPAGLAKSKWFEHYAQHFDTVEINNTFYHLPKPQTLTKWRELAMPRIITGEMVYIRFHGTAARYSGSYSDEMPADWRTIIGGSVCALPCHSGSERISAVRAKNA